MPKITYIEASGESIIVEAPIGTSLMQAAIDNLVTGIVAECGGGCSCATCHVYIDDQSALVPPEEMERELLGALSHSEAKSRLSCQILISDALDGLIVRLPESQY